MKYVILMASLALLTGCSPEEKFEGKLFCAEREAYIIKFHTGKYLYRFDRTPAADPLCKDKT